VFVYRSLQLLCGYLSVIAAKIWITFHMVILHLLLVVTVAMAIHHTQFVFEQRNYALMVLGGFSMGTVLFVVPIECFLAGMVVERGDQVKKNLLKFSGRRRFAFKTAWSFRPHRIVLTYPFFDVDNSTWLEFLNISTDHLVNLLLLTK